MKFSWLPGHIERIVRLERNEHRAALPLVDEVETVIEELAEQGEPLIERRRVGIGRNVPDQSVPVPIGGERRGVGLSILIDDQVADGPRLRIHHHAAGLSVRGSVLGNAKFGIGQSRKDMIRGAIIVMTGDDAVARAADRSNPERQGRIADRRMRFA